MDSVTQPIRLLHLEDDPRDAALIHDRLLVDGLECSIVHVSTGADFEATLTRGGFDLVLSDFNIVGYNGLEALVHARERQPETPIIVISGALGEEDAIRCLQLGATDYLLKQRLDRLVPAVRRALHEAETLREHRRAELELRESEERHRLIFQCSPVPMLVYDAGSLQFLTVSRSAVTSYGWSEEEFVTMTLRDLETADDGNELSRFAAPAANTRPARHRTRRGEIIDVEVTSADIRFGGRAARLALAIDVTQRKRAEVQLRQQQEQYRAIVEAVRDGIVIVDLTGRIVTTNEAARQLGGYTEADVVGAPMAGFMRPADRATIEMLASQARLGEPGYAEAVHLRKDGSEIQVVIHSAAFQMNGLPHILLVVSNVSEQKRLQQQLERTERIGSLGRLAASIAHEMNNVMMGMLPFVEIVKFRAQGDSVLENAASHLMRGIARGKGITQEILRFTRADEQLELAPTDASRLLSDIEAETRPILGDAVRLKISCEEGLFILGDAAQLNQVITNMVRNAHEAMSNGGDIDIQLHTSTAQAVAYFAAMGEPASWAHLQVSDTGRGIPPHVIAHIFEPLFTTKAGVGTGLGLAITQQIVTAHGGQVRVESRPNVGTTFHVLLRKTSARAIDAGSKPETDTVWQGIRSVVLVEDDPSIAEGIMALLSLENVDCQWFSSGGSALEWLRSSSPDLLILDVGLPDMSGVDVHREVVRSQPRLPTIFSTGHGDRRMLGELMNPGLFDFLTKPYDFDALSRKVEQLIRRSRD